jgi:spermidine/putrescine transport system permease protein
MLQVGRRADFPMASALSMILMLVVTAAYLLFAKRLRMERV